MKRTLQFISTFVFAVSLLCSIQAEEIQPAAAELKELVDRVITKLSAGPATVESLESELAAFESLITKYQDDAEQVAEIAFMHASLYTQVLKDLEKGKKLLSELEANYPDTRFGKMATKTLYQMTPEGKAELAAQQEESEKKRQATLAALIGSPAPELDFTWSTDSSLQQLSDLKGQVVVIDFWATWCGPCLRAFPEMRKHVTHFEESPVTFLGVTSLQGRVSNLSSGKVNTRGNPDLEYDLMTQFIEEYDITWPVTFSKQNVFNPEYGVRGIPSAVIIAPDGTVRHAGLHPGNPQADLTGKIAAILEEFNLPLPDSEH